MYRESDEPADGRQGLNGWIGQGCPGIGRGWRHSDLVASCGHGQGLLDCPGGRLRSGSSGLAIGRRVLSVRSSVVDCVCNGGSLVAIGRWGLGQQRVDIRHGSVPLGERWYLHVIQGQIFVVVRCWGSPCWTALLRLREVLLEPPPPAVKPHGEDVLTGAQTQQEVGTKPLLLVEDPKREECRK